MKQEEFQNPKERATFGGFETEEKIVGPKGLGKKIKKLSVFEKLIGKNSVFQALTFFLGVFQALSQTLAKLFALIHRCL